jgi:hypothetical protein
VRHRAEHRSGSRVPVVSAEDALELVEDDAVRDQPLAQQ